MKQYEKPVVIYSPEEPVEAGCCPTSCGWSPGRHLNKEAGKTLAMLEEASSKLKSDR